MSFLKLCAIGTALVVVVGCSDKRFTESKSFAGVTTEERHTVSAETLNLGYEQYMLNCYACHGEDGDGKGPAAAYLRPPPRDFRQGLFKFGGVSAGELPHNEDLIRLVKRGLTGTAMLPWDLPDESLRAIVEYIKLFSESPTGEEDDTYSHRWQDPDNELGERITASEDPWKGKEKAAVIRGAKVYHATAQCSRCHPAYSTKQEIAAYNKELLDMDTAQFGADMYRSFLRDSDYGVKILPIDFLYHDIKTLHPDDNQSEQLKQLYLTIGAGIGGTAMPAWKGSLSEEDLWSLAYYVQSIYAKKDTKEAYAMREALQSQPAFVPAQPSADTDTAIQ